MNWKIFSEKTVICLSLLIVVQQLYFIYIWQEKVYSIKAEPYEPGCEFAVFKKYLGDINSVGYLTDKSFVYSSSLSANFLFGQYALAPVVFNYNNTDFQFVFLDFVSPRWATEKLKELKPKTVYRGPGNLVLIQRY